MRVTSKIFLLVVLALLIVRPTSSYAWHGHDHAYVDVRLGAWPGYYYGYPYYPYNYYDPYYAAPYPEYAVVSASSYQPVVVNGVTYYTNNGAYYMYTQYGYQAVAAPGGAQVAQAVPAIQAAPVTAIGGNTDDVITINIPNDKGGYNAVLIKRSGNGYVGPQGEFYAEFPKVAQLKVMYGK